MTTKIRAKSTLKLVSDSGVNSTWEFSKGQPLISVVRDIIMFNPIPIDDLEKMLNEALADIKSRG